MLSKEQHVSRKRRHLQQQVSAATHYTIIKNVFLEKSVETITFNLFYPCDVRRRNKSDSTPLLQTSCCHKLLLAPPKRY